tara:strand:- start:462 stop:1508 length:1047 start_codon:yes stop_codon:yes gene_type:complete
MEPGMQAGDDPSLDAPVAAIMAKLRGGAMEEKPDRRENREDRDDLDKQGTNDLDESDRLARQDQPEDGESQADAETESAEKADEEAEAFIELPPAEEGGEPTRIPVSEATEAVQKLRQMNGEIATAVIKAEEDAFAKQDQVTQAMSRAFEQVELHAQASIRMMQKFAPLQPHPDDYHTTEDYYRAKLHFDSYQEQYTQILGTVKQAQAGQGVLRNQEMSEFERRETDRITRFIPEFKEPATRETRKAEILEHLKGYGVTKADLDDIVDHKAWRIMSDLAKLKAAEKKAPEVKKHLQETKPRIVNGRVSTVRDPSSGQFVSKARTEHAKVGTEESFAKLLMRSGALKNL